MKKKMLLSGVALALVGTFLATPALAQRRATRAARPATTAEPPATSTTSAGQILPLKRVVLYSNGVAYFERRGTVTGRAEIALDFKQSQIDDVLKSMLVLDLGKGRIESVSYNTSLPAEARLDEIPFAVDAAEPSGLAAVLKKLQGTRVSVTGSQKTVVGAVLTVQEHPLAEADTESGKEKSPTRMTRRLVISGDDGELASFDLSDIRSLKVIDGDTRRDIRTFTEAKSAERRRDSKTIVVTSEGTGTRELVVSYTIAAPIWKTSYRVVLDKAGKPFFQGWAIVDNVSEEDWNGIALSLVSGDPTSFIQPLQQPMFKYREEKGLPEGVQLTPQRLSLLGGSESSYSGRAGGVEGGVPGGVPGGVVGGSGEASPPPPPKEEAKESGYAGTSVADLGEAIRTGDAGVSTAAEGVEAGDLFEYRVGQPVTVARNRSALIPIVQKEMTGERVSLFDSRIGGERPRNGFFVENTSGLTLENGPLTVIDGDSYGGEGELERLKPKEKRFIGFGTDLATKVTRKTERTKDPVALVRVRGGRFETFYVVKDQTTFTLTNQSDRPRTLFLDFPMPDKWKFADEVPKPESVENGLARFRIELAPREVKSFPVTLKLMLADVFELASLTGRDLELFVNRNYLDEPSKKLFDRILEIKARRDEAGGRAARAEEEIRNIEADQKRLRENITALGGKAEAKQLMARYVAKADAQESQLEQLRADVKKARADRAAAQDELDVLIRTIAFERPLK